jgi:hypothetical protein
VTEPGLVAGTAAVRTHAFEEVRGLLVECRGQIAVDVSDGPCRDHLVRYATAGKLLRPLLVFLSASAVGGNPSDALVASRAVELAHTASLIHDDIVDQANHRRGGPAMHVLVGVERALIVADYLLFRAVNVIAAADALAPDTRNELLATLTFHGGVCARAQIEELEGSPIQDPEDAYVSLVRRKTGSQFAAAAAMGAIAARAAAHEIKALTAYGENVGIAFQIEDDLADVAEDSRLVKRSSVPASRSPQPLLDPRGQTRATLGGDVEFAHKASRAQKSALRAASEILATIAPPAVIPGLYDLPRYATELARAKTEPSITSEFM